MILLSWCYYFLLTCFFVIFNFLNFEFRIPDSEFRIPAFPAYPFCFAPTWENVIATCITYRQRNLQLVAVIKSWSLSKMHISAVYYIIYYCQCAFKYFHFQYKVSIDLRISGVILTALVPQSYKRVEKNRTSEFRWTKYKSPVRKHLREWVRYHWMLKGLVTLHLNSYNL